MAIQEILESSAPSGTITLNEWVATLPIVEQSEFAAAEARRAKLVSDAVAAGVLIVDPDDAIAAEALRIAIASVDATLPVGTTSVDRTAKLEADPAVIDATEKMKLAINTPIYQWTSKSAQDSTEVQDTVWLTFWDRWVEANKLTAADQAAATTV